MSEQFTVQMDLGGWRVRPRKQSKMKYTHPPTYTGRAEAEDSDE